MVALAARTLSLVLAGALLGLAWNTWSGRGFDLRANVLVRPGDELVDAAEAKARQDKGALVLDARMAEFYALGHVPGALLLPENDFDRAFPALENRLRGALEVVVYCSGYGCEASHIVARRLKERGIPAVILHDGMPAWTEAGYPTHQGDAE